MVFRLLLAGLAALASGAAFRWHVSTGLPALRMLATILLVASGLLLAWAMERWQIAEALAELERRLAARPDVTCLALPRVLARRYRWERGYLAVGPGGVMLLAAVGLSNTAWTGLARPKLRAHASSLRQAVRELKARVLSSSRPHEQAPPPSSSAGLASPAGEGPSAALVGTAPGTGLAGPGSHVPLAATGLGSSPEPHTANPAAASAEGVSRSVPVFGMLVLLRRRVLPAEREMVRLQGVGLANPVHFPRQLEVIARVSLPGWQPLSSAWQHAVREAARQAWKAQELAAPAGLPAAGQPAPASKG